MDSIICTQYYYLCVRNVCMVQLGQSIFVLTNFMLCELIACSYFLLSFCYSGVLLCVSVCMHDWLLVNTH